MSTKLFSSFLHAVKPVGLRIGITGTPHQQRTTRRAPEPKLRYPYWYMKKERTEFDEKLTPENEAFVQEVLNDTYNVSSNKGTTESSPLKVEPPSREKWQEGYMRTGLIARKLGTFPQWLKDGTQICCTLLEVLDNHVIGYKAPGQEKDLRPYAKKLKDGVFGDLVVGAIGAKPQDFTKQYCGLFTKAGVMPKKILTKFTISPEAQILPGTPLYAAHFRVGDWVDITGKTRYHGFQGVMKRWGFHGMPASHGVTKTHRRPGNIGGGGEKGRVWPGKKMPGHMGNKTKTLRGMQIVRINHAHNVIYVKGRGVPGMTNSIVFIHDTLIRKKSLTKEPPFPTYYPEDSESKLPDETFHESLYNFKDGTIFYEVAKQSKRRRS